MSLFGFFQDMGNYAERVVANDEIGDAVIDTAAARDQCEPYETGITHPKYNDGKWIIVQLYETKKDAEIGHKKWVEKMSRSKLPTKLVDVSDIPLTQLMDMAKKDWRTFYRATEALGGEKEK